MPEIPLTLRVMVKEEISKEMGKARKEMEQLQQRSNALKGSVKDLFKELAGPLAGIGSAAGLGLFIKQSIEAASALEALEVRSRTIFGSAFPRMSAEAEKLGSSLHRSASDMMEMQASLANVFQGAGITGRAMETMSRSLTQLSVDFGSFFHIADADAFEAVRGAVLGQTRAITRLGVVMNDTTLQAYSLSKGHKENISDMSEAQQMLLRYSFLLDATRKIQGDAAKNAGLFSNQVKSLSGEWKDFQEVAGKPFLGVLAEGLWTINTAMGAVGASLDILYRDFVRFGNLFGLDKAEKDYRGPELKALKGNLKIEDVRAAAEEQKKAEKDFAKALTGGGSGGTKDSLKEIKNAMKEVGKSYDDVSRDITKDLRQLDLEHKKNMKAMEERINDVKKSISDLGVAYQKTVRDSTQSEVELVSGQQKKIADLKRELEDLNATAGRMDSDFANLILGNRPKGAEGDITASERHAFMLTDERERQLNITRQLRDAEADLATYQKENGSDIVGKATEYGKQTDFQKGVKDLKKRREDEKKDYDKRQGELQDEMKSLEDKKALDAAVYQNMRSQYTETGIALAVFHGDYTFKMQNLALVTAEVAESVKASLEAIRGSISQVDAEVRASSEVGKRISSRREVREARASGGYTSAPVTLVGEEGPELVSLPSGSFVHNNRDTQKMMGGVSVTIQSMVVQKEADVDEVVRRLTRKIQLQILGSR